ncbi:ATP-grasp domain-containing protein [Orbus mooreae]|uniref:ATP-grasp domain-containing protein n=1 Tax=Orbus mooreae TaxID=3074107 RepID=UPI00370D6F13
MRVLVTGVGAIIGYGVINSIRNYDKHILIVGMDIYSDAVGQYWCDQFVQAKPASSEEYPQFLQEVIKQYEIDLVIPCIEQDISRMLAIQPLFAEHAVKFVLPNKDIHHITQDKYLTYLALMKNNINAIPSYIDGNYELFVKQLGSPFLLKPRRSYASKGIVKIENEEDLCYWRKKIGDNFMVQQIVGDNDHEYTASIFGLGNGQYKNSIIFKRKLSGEGATAKAEVIFDNDLLIEITKLTRLFKPSGPTNFQFRKHDGQYLLLEINPRISSSTSIREAFGYNEARMCIEYYLYHNEPYNVEVIKGKAIRYIKDMIC